MPTCFYLNRQEKLEFRWELLFRVEPVTEVDTTNAAVGMDLDSKGLDVISAVSTTSKIRKVELRK
jgi:hypothetical protein